VAERHGEKLSHIIIKRMKRIAWARVKIFFLSHALVGHHSHPLSHIPIISIESHRHYMQIKS
jgi:hypothetical protein